MILVRLFIFFGGLFALGLIALLIGPYFIDWTEYRSEFQQQASRILGQKVTVNGDAELRILPFPSLTFSDLTVGENASGQPMMTAKQFEMDLEITPFLSGEILIFDMRVVEPKLTVTLLNDGTLDWALRNEKQLAGNTLVLEKISVTDGDITFVDLQNQRTENIQNINATLAAPEIAGPWNINGTASLANQKINYAIDTGTANSDGHIRLRSQLSIEGLPLKLESEGDAKIIDKKPSYKGKFSIAKLPDKNILNTAAEFRSLLSLKINGNFNANSERLEISEYRLASGKAADPYIVEGEALVDTGVNPEFLVTAKGQQIDVAQLADDKKEAQTPEGIKSGFEQLRLIIEELPVPDFPGLINLSLPALVAGQTTIRDIELNARPQSGGWIIDKFEAKLPGRTNVEANGSLVLGEQPSFDGQLLIASRQPSGFSSWLVGSVDPVIRQMGTAGFSADVVLNQDLQRMENLELIIGASIVKGRAERQSLADKKPSITLTLSGEEIDLNRMAAITRLVNLDKSVDERGGLFNHDVAVQLDAGRMKLDRYSGQDVSTIGSFKSGNLVIDKLTFANFSGANGQLSGSLKNLFEDPVGSVNFQFDAPAAGDIFSLASELTDKHPLIRRLAKNQSQFSDIGLKGDLVVSGSDTPQLSVEGTINESALKIEANLPPLGTPFAAYGTAPSTLKINAQNPQSAKLLAQLGFEVLPFDFEESAELELSLINENAASSDLVAKVISGATTINIDGALDKQRATDITEAKGNFELNIASTDIEPLLLAIGQNPPGIGTGQPVNLSASMQTSPNIVSVGTMEGDAEGNSFLGNLTFDNSGRNLAINGDLQVDQLDLEWFYELALGVRIEHISEEIWNPANFLPPYEFTPRAELKLSANTLRVPNAETVRDFSSSLTVGPGEIALSNMEGAWLGGEVLGNFAISNPDGKAFASLNGSIDGADIRRLSWLADGNPILKGDVEILGQVEGAGDNLSEILQSLNGGGLYNASNIKISCYNPDIFIRILSQVDNQDNEITPELVAKMAEQYTSEGDYEVEKLSLPFTITGGQQRLSSINIEDDLFELTGEARFDIAKQTMNAKLDILHDPQLEVQTGATPELTYIYTGAVDRPQSSIDANAMSNFLSIRAYERERRRVELLQASILERQRLRREISLVKDQQFRREEVARLKAEEEARIRAEEEARRLAEEEAKRLAEEERLRALEEARRLQEEAARRAEAERKAIEEAKRIEEEARIAAEEAAKRKAEAERVAAEEAEAARLKAEEEARLAKEKELAEQKRLEEQRIAAENAEAERKQAQRERDAKLKAERIAKANAEAAAQEKRALEEKAAEEKNSSNWQSSVEQILSGSRDDDLSGNSIIVIPLDAPTSE